METTTTLHKLRKINSFILSFGLFYLIQNFTIGQLLFLKSIFIFNGILLKELIFVVTSICLNFILFNWKINK